MRKPTLCRVRPYFVPGLPSPTKRRTGAYFFAPLSGAPPFAGAAAPPAAPAAGAAAPAAGAAPGAPGAAPGAPGAAAAPATASAPGTAAAGAGATSSFSGMFTTAMVAFLMTFVLNRTPSGGLM